MTAERNRLQQQLSEAFSIKASAAAALTKYCEALTSSADLCQLVMKDGAAVAVKQDLLPQLPSTRQVSLALEQLAQADRDIRRLEAALGGRAES